MNKQIVMFIITWIQQLNSIEVREIDDLFTIGLLDSLSFAEMVAAVEDEFLVEFDFAEVENWESVRTPLGLAEFCKVKT